MRRTILALSVLCGATELAHADSRYFCSADDKDVRFTIESGFAAGGGHKLNHFRGAIQVKREDVAPALSKIVFGSSNLTHHWSDGGELRLEIYYNGGDEPDGQALNLVISAERPEKSATAFSGTYELVVDGTKPATAGGKVSCGSK